MIKFEDMLIHGTSLRSGYSTRDKDFKTYEDMYLCKDTDLPDRPGIKGTISPDARNALRGAVRLLTATTPSWSVPHEGNDPLARQMSSKIETASNAIWKAAGRVVRRPNQIDLVHSAMLYDEVCVTIRLTKLITEMASKENKARAEAVEKKTPVLFEVINPKIGYPQFDSLGLAAYYGVQEKQAGEVIAMFGDKAAKLLADKKSYDLVEFNEYWNAVDHGVWISGIKDPILMEEHKLPAIPMICQIIEGSQLWEKIEDTRQPFLYTLAKSNMWKRQNLILTAMYSNIFAIAANPTFLYTTSDPNAEAVKDYSQIGGEVRIRNGEMYGPLAKNVIDPGLAQGYEITKEKTIESTIYRQALGEAPSGGNNAFSTVSLLSQAGRLPLVPYQVICSEIIADAMYVALQMLKIENVTTKLASGTGAMIELIAKDIPESFELEASLKIDLPQDMRQNAAIASQLSTGEDPITSKRYAREKILEIGQSDDMDKEIWRERADTMKFMLEFQKKQAEMQQQMAAQQQGMQPGQPGQPGQQGMPPQLPPGPEQQPPMDPSQIDPASMQAMMQGQQGGPGMPAMPLAGPLPPQGQEQLPMQGGM